MSESAVAPVIAWRSASRLGALLRLMRALAILYAAGILIGFTIFALLFKAGLFAGLSVLFFRGLILAGLSCALTFALLGLGLTRLRRRALGARDAFSAAILSLSFNICFLVVVPVTVDRSISVFVLGEMAAHPDDLYSSDDMSRLFTTVYVGDYQQIDRRLREQTITGNVEKIGEAYRISPRGRAFIEAAKWTGWLFGGDTRLASPPSDGGRR